MMEDRDDRNPLRHPARNSRCTETDAGPDPGFGFRERQRLTLDRRGRDPHAARELQPQPRSPTLMPLDRVLKFGGGFRLARLPVATHCYAAPRRRGRCNASTTAAGVWATPLSVASTTSDAGQWVPPRGRRSQDQLDEMHR